MSKYQFSQYHVRYEIDTCNLFHFLFWCQTVVPKNAALRQQTGQIHRPGFTLLSLDTIQMHRYF
jgi:hypothetical protein